MEDKKTVQLIVEQGLANQFGSTGASVLKSLVARKKQALGKGVRANQCEQEARLGPTQRNRNQQTQNL